MSAVIHGRGRPLRFLALVVVGWIVLRILFLWPQTGSLPEAIREVLALPSFAPREAMEPAAGPRIVTAAPMAAPVSPVLPDGIAHLVRSERVSDPGRVELARFGMFQFGAAEYTDSPAAPVAPAQTAFDPAPSRWSASAWLTLRPGAGLGAAPGGQLGGSQAGVRIAWMVDERHRVAVFGRFVTPIQGKGREAALGVEWQPSSAPVRIVAEQRFAVDGGKGGPALGLVAGTDNAIPGGFRLESYGQAGAIRRARIEPYADGAARATRPVMGGFSLGVGAWGAAQRDAARVDVGPSATLSVPVAGQRLRLALDWRQRVAGDARPGSGVALTLGSDF